MSFTIHATLPAFTDTGSTFTVLTSATTSYSYGGATGSNYWTQSQTSSLKTIDTPSGTTKVAFVFTTMTQQAVGGGGFSTESFSSISNSTVSVDSGSSAWGTTSYRTYNTDGTYDSASTSSTSGSAATQGTITLTTYATSTSRTRSNTQTVTSLHTYAAPGAGTTSVASSTYTVTANTTSTTSGSWNRLSTTTTTMTVSSGFGGMRLRTVNATVLQEHEEAWELTDAIGTGWAPLTSIASKVTATAGTVTIILPYDLVTTTGNNLLDASSFTTSYQYWLGTSATASAADTTNPRRGLATGTINTFTISSRSAYPSVAYTRVKSTNILPQTSVLSTVSTAPSSFVTTTGTYAQNTTYQDITTSTIGRNAITTTTSSTAATTFTTPTLNSQSHPAAMELTTITMTTASSYSFSYSDALSGGSAMLSRRQVFISSGASDDTIDYRVTAETLSSSVGSITRVKESYVASGTSRIAFSVIVLAPCGTQGFRGLTASAQTTPVYKIVSGTFDHSTPVYTTQTTTGSPSTTLTIASYSTDSTIFFPFFSRAQGFSYTTAAGYGEGATIPVQYPETTSAIRIASETTSYSVSGNTVSITRSFSMSILPTSLGIASSTTTSFTCQFAFVSAHSVTTVNMISNSSLSDPSSAQTTLRMTGLYGGMQWMSDQNASVYDSRGEHLRTTDSAGGTGTTLWTMTTFSRTNPLAFAAEPMIQGFWSFPPSFNPPAGTNRFFIFTKNIESSTSSPV